MYLKDHTDASYADRYLYAFLIFFPVLLLVSWLLEMAVDNPSVKFAHKIDAAMRKKRP